MPREQQPAISSSVHQPDAISAFFVPMHGTCDAAPSKLGRRVVNCDCAVNAGAPRLARYAFGQIPFQAVLHLTALLVGVEVADPFDRQLEAVGAQVSRVVRRVAQRRQQNFVFGASGTRCRGAGPTLPAESSRIGPWSYFAATRAKSTLRRPHAWTLATMCS